MTMTTFDVRVEMHENDDQPYPDPEAPEPSSGPYLPYYGLGLNPYLDDDPIQYETDDEDNTFSEDALSSPSIAPEDLEIDRSTDDKELEEGVPHRGLASLQASKAQEDLEYIPCEEQEFAQYSDDESAELAFATPRESHVSEGRRGSRRGRGKRGVGRRYNDDTFRATNEHTESPPPSFRGRRRGRPPRGEGRRGGPGKKKPRLPVEPTPYFKDLQVKATTAFLRENYDEAAGHAQEAVQSNPEIFAAHSLLAQILYSMGKVENSLTVLWAGAHTRREVSVWWEVATRTLQYTGNREPETLKQILYCYTQIVKMDPRDFEARKGKLEIYLELDCWLKAVKECEAILKMRPYDLEILQTYSEHGVRLNTVSNVKSAYDKAVQHYRKTQADGSEGDFSFTDLNVYLGLFAMLKEWREGIVVLKSTARWLCGRKNETCWKGFHENDCEWDIQDEPRRVAVEGFKPDVYPDSSYGTGLPYEIRAKLGIFRLRLGPRHIEEALHHFEYFRPDDGGPGAPVHEYPESFKEIGNALQDAQCYSEALKFYECRKNHAKLPELPTRKRMGHCYHKLGNLDKAIEYYNSVLQKDRNDVDTRLHLAEAYEKYGHPSLAYEVAARVVRQGRSDLVKTAKLQRLTRELLCDGDSQALPLKYPVVSYAPKPASNQEQNESEPSTLMQQKRPVISHSRKRPSEKAKLLDRYFQRIDRSSLDPQSDERSEGSLLTDLKSKHDHLQALINDARSGNDAATTSWMEIAQALIAPFVTRNISFPNEKDIDNLDLPELLTHTNTVDILRQTKSERASERDAELFRSELQALSAEHDSILFSDWLAIFCDLSLFHARRGNAEASYITLGAAMRANAISRNRVIMRHLHYVQISCSLLLRDLERLSTTARWLIREYPLAAEPYMLYSAVHRLGAAWAGTGGGSLFQDSTNQKFMVQRVKLLDFALLSEDQRKLFPFTEPESHHFALSRAVKGNPGSAGLKREPGITAPNQHLLYLQGNLIASGGPPAGAINFYLRVYAAEKRNALNLLSLAVTMMYYAFRKKFMGNRHHHVLQALAWFGEYRKVRLDEAGADVCGTREATRRRMEVEFNEARLYHGMGLPHLALPKYLRCLQIAEENDQKDREDSKHDHSPSITCDSRQHSLENAHAIVLTDTVYAENDPAHGQSDTSPSQPRAESVEYPDFTREAAYALQLTLAFGGDVEAARAVGEKWLVF